jgi:hypothetical protein
MRPENDSDFSKELFEARRIIKNYALLMEKFENITNSIKMLENLNSELHVELEDIKNSENELKLRCEKKYGKGFNIYNAILSNK